MTSSVPDCIAWPLILAMAAVIAVRYRWFNENLYDTYFNNTLLLMLIAQLLRQHSVEELLDRYAVMTVTMAQHLSLVLVFFMAAEFMGFITMWARLSPEDTQRRHRYHRAAATILAAAFFVLTTRARVAGQLLEESGGWDNVAAWALYAVLPVALAVLMVNMCLKEIRRPDAKPRERLVAGSAIPIGVAIAVTTLIAVGLECFDELGWTHTLPYRLRTHAFIFFWEAIGTTAVAAIPVMVTAWALLGLNSTSRTWRQLQTLRTDMVIAVPDADFDVEYYARGRRRSGLELHQTTIQIRDAILQLRPYTTELDHHQTGAFLEKFKVPVDQRSAATGALQLATAVQTKSSGSAPAEDGAHGVTLLSTNPANLDEEIAELLALARWWPPARAHLITTQLEQIVHVCEGEQR
ncbi:DUF6545 domain-containing protein [Mycobacteroides abscessus]|uniref:DUF6545 domain-containing protein n=1 Tax=Mycobacteroides abscessus TaxID=36809 RepID=UPI00210218CA|nr:DUF6545 domain-containing protein [Mycobacteroides abscessus]